MNFKIYTKFLLILFSFAFCFSNVLKASEKEDFNVLTSKEKAKGWQLLFDGKTFNQWRGYNGKDVTKNWTVENGTLKSLGLTAGDLVTVNDYENFELTIEWRISKGGNSGILYGVIEDSKYKRVSETGPEYQLLDDIGYPAKLQESQLTGANYEMHVADKRKKKLKSIESAEFNTARIIVNKNHVEHWLNGKKIVDFERWTDDWHKRKNLAKWKDYPGYGLAKKGKIALQDHGSNIWFRNIKIREL